MTNNKILVKFAAITGAAGRSENEDNFQIAEDLAISNSGFSFDNEIDLGPLGSLLLVCDGMGGMNAGEVASAVATETIKDYFSKDNLSSVDLYSDESICDFVKNAIVNADAAIKKSAAENSEHDGMGSTAVLVWLLGTKAYVGWCGDSRAYRYNANHGLMQLSHDHSYVQELVDSGQLPEELAFDHPNKNVITRSLGDPRDAAKPDTKVFEIADGDIFLLCSDGLSDALRDRQIESIISKHQSSMVECRDALWEGAKNAGWFDNVTVVLANTHRPGAKRTSSTNRISSTTSSEPTIPNRPDNGSKFSLDFIVKKLAYIIAGVVLGAIVVFFCTRHNKTEDILVETKTSFVFKGFNYNKELTSTVENVTNDAIANALNEYFDYLNGIKVDNLTEKNIEDSKTNIEKSKQQVKEMKDDLSELKGSANDFGREEDSKKIDNLQKKADEIYKKLDKILSKANDNK